MPPMAEPAWDDLITVGRVARAHGNRGHVIVDPDTDFPARRFREGATLRVRRGGRVETLTVEAVRFHRGRPIVGFREIGTMTDAEALARAELRVPAADLEALPEGQYYRHDLVGCQVMTRSGVHVGRVVRVEGDWQSSRLAVDADGREVLVPLAAEICVRIDLVAREIVIDPPEGLLDLNR